MNFIIDNFDKLFNSEESIKRLEEIILDLAVKGKLVSQDPNDESASALLEKIKAEKEHLIKDKKIKKDKDLEPITEAEIPFEIPESWQWVRLGEVSENIHYGYTASANFEKTETRLLRITDIQNNTVNWEGVPGCDVTEKEFNSYGLNENDILIARTGGTIGKSYIVKDISVKAVFASYLIRVIPSKLSNPIFIKLLIETPMYWKQLIEKSMGTGQPNVNGQSLSNLVLPLPPLSEQKRIVEKVDKLKELINQFREKIQKRDKVRQGLKASIMNEIEKSNSNHDLLENLERIFRNFDSVVKTKDDIKDIRDLVLSLAVKGKLVPQDSSDEPASVLLEKIKVEKEQLIKEKKIKKDKDLTPITEEEIPFEIPESWEWVRLGEISELITKGSSPNWQGINYIENNGVLFITSENVGTYNLLLHKKKYLEWKFNEIQPRSILEKGDLLMNIVGGSIGRTAEFNLDETSNINQAVCLIRMIKKINLTYMLLFFNSKICITYMFDKQVDNARANLSMGNISKFQIPLPPLAEQKRIVLQVEKLMKVCDELEKLVEKSQKEANKLWVVL